MDSAGTTLRGLATGEHEGGDYGEAHRSDGEFACCFHVRCLSCAWSVSISANDVFANSWFSFDGQQIVSAHARHGVIGHWIAGFGTHGMRATTTARGLATGEREGGDDGETESCEGEFEGGFHDRCVWKCCYCFDSGLLSSVLTLEGRNLCLVTDAVSHRATAMRAAMLQAAGLEEGGHRRFAIGAFHRLCVLEDIVGTTLASGADLHRALHPDGLALVAGDGAGGICRGRLAGGH